jgi:hypothetical protein
MTMTSDSSQALVSALTPMFSRTERSTDHELALDVQVRQNRLLLGLPIDDGEADPMIVLHDRLGDHPADGELLGLQHLDDLDQGVGLPCPR